MAAIKKVMITAQVEFDAAAAPDETSVDAFVTEMGLGEVISAAAEARWGAGGTEPGVTYTNAGQMTVNKDLV